MRVPTFEACTPLALQVIATARSVHPPILNVF